MTAFEIVTLIVNGALLIVTGGATVVAWAMAIGADRGKRGAEEARDAALAAQRAASDALAEANRIAEAALAAQKLALPPEWGVPTPTAVRHGFAIQNTSGRTIVVTRLEVDPRGNVYAFTPPTLPSRVQHGDALRFAAVPGGAASADGNAVVLTWAFEDEAAVVRATERHF